MNEFSRRFGRKKSSRKNGAGAQIDLLLDRADGVIHLCELKYAREPFVVDKLCAQALKHKLEVFESVTGTKKKTVFTLVSPYGLSPNTWSEGLIERSVSVEALLG